MTPPKPDRAASVCPLPFSETYFNGVVDTIGTIAFFEDENEEDGRPGIFVLSTEDDMRSVGPNYFGQKVFLVPEKVLTELASARAELAGRVVTQGSVDQVTAWNLAQLLVKTQEERKAAEQELAEWKRNAEEYSQEAKDELDRRLAAEQEAERLRGVVAAAVALLEAVVAYVTAPGEFAEAPFDEKPITAFLAELKGQKL